MTYLWKKTSVSLRLTIKRSVRYMIWIKSLSIVRCRVMNARALHLTQNAFDAPPSKHGLEISYATLI